MREEKGRLCLLLLFVTIYFTACSLDSEGTAAFPAGTGDAGADVADQETGNWPESSTPDADAEPDVLPDAPEDVLEADATVPDAPDDVMEADAPLDVLADIIEADSPVDAPDDVIEADAPVDAPEDVVEADALSPVECFGVPTEAGHVMLCAELPGGLATSLVIKAEIVSAEPNRVIPFKSVCWSEVGTPELACFPCPGPNVCWPVPAGGFEHASVASGDVIKFQPGVADAPGLDMKNTVCDIGKCFDADITVYSGHTEVCRLKPDGSITGGTSEGTGKDVKIVCPL